MPNIRGITAPPPQQEQQTVPRGTRAAATATQGPEQRVSRLSIENFRGIAKAELHFSGHTLLIGGNNVGKITVCV